MKEIIADISLVAACGLYCGACNKYLKGSCPGCAKNEKASWCKTRSCCATNGFRSCADCKTTNHVDCKKINNFISKAFGLFFNTDRLACLDAIKKDGYQAFVDSMTLEKRMAIPRKKTKTS